jgi:hypothetical protein
MSDSAKFEVHHVFLFFLGQLTLIKHTDAREFFIFYASKFQLGTPWAHLAPVASSLEYSCTLWLVVGAETPWAVSSETEVRRLVDLQPVVNIYAD